MSQHFVVCIPYFGALDPGHVECVSTLAGRGVRILKIFGNPYIDHARATLAAMAMAEKAPVSLWIDHDIIFRPDDVFATVDALLAAPEYAMAGVCYPTKVVKGHIVGTPDLDENPTAEFYTDRMISGLNTGMGFTAIRNSCFEAVAKHHDLPLIKCPSTDKMVYPFFRHLIRDGTYLGEDYSFCTLVREAGLKIGLYLKPRLIHKGGYGYILEDSTGSVPKQETFPVTFRDLDAEKKAAE